MISRRGFIALPGIIPRGKTDKERIAALEKNQAILAQSVLELINAMGQVSSTQKAIIEGMVLVEKRVIALEAKMFPNLEQGDDLHG